MSDLSGVLTLLETLEASNTSPEEIIRQIKAVCSDAHALQSMSPCIGTKRVRSLSMFDKEFEDFVRSPAESSQVPVLMPVAKGKTVSDTMLLSRYRAMKASLAEMEDKQKKN
jgi:hypothetical protein